MQYTIIENFLAGLDRRRSVLTSVPGALYTLENAHVNQGGEIEKRQKYAVQGSNGFHASSFGLENTENGLVAFCSEDPSGWNAPTGVTYLRCRHPDAATLMTSVVFSCNYNGKAFCYALFADGKKFLFYNGTIIPQSWEGVILTGMTSLATLSTQLKTAVEREAADWTVTDNANGINGNCLIYSPSGIYMSLTNSWVSTLGYIAAMQTDTDGVGTPGTSARASFHITAAGNGDTFTVVADRPTSGTYTLASSIAFTTDIATTVAAIVAEINLYTGATGYYARVAASDATVFIVYAEASLGATMNNKHVTITYTGTSAVSDGGAISPSLSVSVFVPTGYGDSNWGRDAYVWTTAQTTVIGATGTLTYKWEEQWENSSYGITCSDTAAAQPTFSRNMFPGDRGGIFKLTVTDSSFPSSPIVVENIYVHLVCT